MVLGADSLMDMKLRTGEAAMGAVCCVESKGYFDLSFLAVFVRGRVSETENEVLYRPCK
jgi:hypothetical protein